MSKRYYWLKLNESFFDREEIKIIESMDNGKDYIIFYMKLLLKSIKAEGELRFRNTIPYTPEMLATITNTNIDTVRVAIEVFTGLELMEKWDDGTLFMNELDQMIGSETASAKRVREHRRRKALEEKKETKMLQCNDGVTKSNTEIDTEIELEIEKDIEIKKDIEISEVEEEKPKKQFNKDYIIDTWNSLDNRISKVVSINYGTKRYNSLKARVEEYGEREVIKAIQSIDDSEFLKGNNDRGWKITFDWFVKPNNFIKVLEGNYIEKKEIDKEKANIIASQEMQAKIERLKSIL